MAKLHELKAYYDDLDWQRSGENWAKAWGGTDVQWFGTILPRIHLFLPAAAIVEIGPGHGRLSRYLAPRCDRLVLIDIAPACVHACRRLFEDDPGVECLLGEGQRLDGVGDGKAGFVFSFFSLVHTDDETMRPLLEDLARTLARDGVAFLHHSNGADCLIGDGVYDAMLSEYRDTSVSASLVAAMAREAGLACRSQEIFSWESGQPLTDCFSVLCRPGSRWARPRTVVSNADFPLEAERWRKLAQVYGALGSDHRHAYGL